MDNKEKEPKRFVSMKLHEDLVDRLDKYFYTLKLDGSIGNKNSYWDKIFSEYLDSKGF